MGIVMLCNSGPLSIRYIYTQSATPDLEVQNFGMLTQTCLEVRRVVFGVDPDDPSQRSLSKWNNPLPDDVIQVSFPIDSRPTPEHYHIMDIDFPSLIENETDETLLEAHLWFEGRDPTSKNEWTGRFEGKNLIWIVAESFSTLAMDPQRTPTLWKLSHEGIICENFYTPLWGVSTSDGEYVTTTGLIPKSGVWSYSGSSDNYMPFGFGNQFQ